MSQDIHCRYSRTWHAPLLANKQNCYFYEQSYIVINTSACYQVWCLQIILLAEAALCYKVQRVSAGAIGVNTKQQYTHIILSTCNRFNIHCICFEWLFTFHKILRKMTQRLRDVSQTLRSLTTILRNLNENSKIDFCSSVKCNETLQESFRPVTSLYTR